VLADVSW
jgi:hypothetical protein